VEYRLVDPTQLLHRRKYSPTAKNNDTDTLETTSPHGRVIKITNSEIPRVETSNKVCTQPLA